MAINYAMLNLYQFIVSLLVICHWLACAWGVTITVDRLTASGELTWQDHYPYLTESDSAVRKYLTSLYWSIATVTTLRCGRGRAAAAGPAGGPKERGNSLSIIISHNRGSKGGPTRGPLIPII